MRRPTLAFACLPILMLAITAGRAQAATVIDATGDFLPTYAGPKLDDLDVTSFSVNFDTQSSIFNLGATFASAIDPTTAGIYVIGVNTGTGLIRPFASVGQPNVIFNQAITIRKDGTGSIGGTALSTNDIVIAGNTLSLRLSPSLLPSTGFRPEEYGFNLWPRVGTGNNNQIADFSPENATLSVSAVPEPSTWAMMLFGFGAIGYTVRSSKAGRTRVSPANA